MLDRLEALVQAALLAQGGGRCAPGVALGPPDGRRGRGVAAGHGLLGRGDDLAVDRALVACARRGEAQRRRAGQAPRVPAAAGARCGAGVDGRTDTLKGERRRGEPSWRGRRQGRHHLQPRAHRRARRGRAVLALHEGSRTLAEGASQLGVGGHCAHVRRGLVEVRVGPLAVGGVGLVARPDRHQRPVDRQAVAGVHEVGGA